MTSGSRQGLLRTVSAKAKAKNIKVLVGTILPYKGASYYDADGEMMRQTVNEWIRANKEIDGVVDFDLAMRSSADPSVMNPDLNSGDGLHPNDAGYAAMANAVDLRMLQ